MESEQQNIARPSLRYLGTVCSLRDIFSRGFRTFKPGVTTRMKMHVSFKLHSASFYTSARWLQQERHHEVLNGGGGGRTNS